MLFAAAAAAESAAAQQQLGAAGCPRFSNRWEKETQKETPNERQTERQTDRQRDRQTERQGERDRGTDREIQKGAERDIYNVWRDRKRGTWSHMTGSCYSREELLHPAGGESCLYCCSGVDDVSLLLVSCCSAGCCSSCRLPMASFLLYRHSNSYCLSLISCRLLHTSACRCTAAAAAAALLLQLSPSPLRCIFSSSARMRP